MKKKDIYSVFERYLTKTTIDKDEENLESWINESEENESLFEKLENHWNSPGHKKISILKSEEVKKEIWDRRDRCFGHRRSFACRRNEPSASSTTQGL